ncbi:hypothetical protein PFUGPA_01073 [Plasmodium falciparum Palo Alto/Uganda]|uniref:Rifin n=1 Tax=Plasmodium falciparum (isolate Palo Alto / Uganda) TaxID=57270 RepID=W4J413_PLAFP|nr:hypothetical protein PFUGPA_01073 [Plasmodium falciparum Palo Alto/Uganda]
MKVHYINILLFALPLNILVYNQRNYYITPRHTETNRSLCECELYSPANYDSDPEMKRVMQQFHDRTTQRFQEYDEKLQEKRQICKDKCDKEIQKIILKDKLEKQMAQQFSTLHTDIQSDAIPTCICERTIADKVEKVCFRCGGVLGGGVMPGFGTIGGTALYALNLLKPAAIEAAKDAAVTEATDAAIEAGIKAVISKINEFLATFTGKEILFDLKPIVNKSNFSCGSSLFQNAKELASKSCVRQSNRSYTSFCNSITYGETTAFKGFAEAGTTTYEKTLESQTSALIEAKVGAVEATYGGYHISIIASIVAIVVIVLIMVIIYLILRYRRKKKMKKKLQYIKLLKE